MLAVSISFSLLFGQTVYANDDGDSVEVGITTIQTYSGTGSPISSNLSATKSIADSLYNEFKSGSAKGWSVRYNHKNTDVLEKDFRSKNYGGNDYIYADNVDLLFYAGHGVRPGYYGSSNYAFVLSTKTDSYYAELGKMELGDKDLEWLVTFTCNFLYGSLDTIGRAAKDIHAICGFRTDMAITSDAGKIFAQACKQGISVKEAYFRYGKNTQPGYLKNTVAVFTYTNTADDRLWGYGTVGPDPIVYSYSKKGYILYEYRCNWL